MVSLHSFSDLQYGIPKFIPLNIKSSAKVPINKGVSFLNFVLTEKPILYPSRGIDNIIGNVPRPNAAIYHAPAMLSPEAIAPAIPK